MQNNAKLWTITTKILKKVKNISEMCRKSTGKISGKVQIKYQESTAIVNRKYQSKRKDLWRYHVNTVNLPWKQWNSTKKLLGKNKQRTVKVLRKFKLSGCLILMFKTIFNVQHIFFIHKKPLKYNKYDIWTLDCEFMYF